MALKRINKVCLAGGAFDCVSAAFELAFNAISSNSVILQFGHILAECSPFD